MRRVALAIVLGACALAPAAEAALPLTFAGLYDEGTSGLAEQARLGVGIVRRPLEWARVERSPGRFDFSAYDPDFAEAARAGVSVLPFLVAPPSFRSSRPSRS